MPAGQQGECRGARPRRRARRAPPVCVAAGKAAERGQDNVAGQKDRQNPEEGGRTRWESGSAAQARKVQPRTKATILPGPAKGPAIRQTKARARPARASPGPAFARGVNVDSDVGHRRFARRCPAVAPAQGRPGPGGTGTARAAGQLREMTRAKQSQGKRDGSQRSRRKNRKIPYLTEPAWVPQRQRQGQREA